MNKKYQSASIVMCGAASAALCVAQSFQAVPFAPGLSQGFVNGLSANGSTIAGSTWSGDFFMVPRSGLRWQVGGNVELLSIPGFELSSMATGISADGRAISGYAGNATQGNAFRWTTSMGGQALAGMDIATNISADGNTVIGYPNNSPVNAQRWTAATGTQNIGTISGPFGTALRSIPQALTADGIRIFGGAEVVVDPTPPFPITGFTPFVWNTMSGSTSTIPALNGSVLVGGVNDCTPTGDVLVGGFYQGTTFQIFRWTQTTGYVTVPTILSLNGVSSRVTADGNTIIAGLNFWTMSGGAQDLRTVLTQAGCDFTGWTLQGAIGISDDGLTIAGNGRNPLGQNQGWVATIPAPGAAGVTLLAGMFATKRRRR